MTANIFQDVKNCLQPKLAQIVADLLPGGRLHGKEYSCASLEGGEGNSCKTDIETGIGSDFATGETWSDIIALAALVWGVRQVESAKRLLDRYGHAALNSSSCPCRKPASFAPILSVPEKAPLPPFHHPQYGRGSQFWRYSDTKDRTLAYTVRFETPRGKVVLPLSYWRNAAGQHRWMWKALPEPRPLYGLPTLAEKPDAPVLLVEGEKTSDAAFALFPEYAPITWSGGSNAVRKADASPLRGRHIVIWPDNDKPGFKAALEWSQILHGQAASVRIVLPPRSLPESWDLADEKPAELSLHDCLQNALTPADFARALNLPSNLPSQAETSSSSVANSSSTPLETEDLTLKSWPTFSMKACPGLLGEFVRLATRNSEADPAAVCITALVRFCAEIYGLAPQKGPHIYVGETVHPPRLFAVICGNSSKARKGTSRHPVTKLFGREYCYRAQLDEWRLPMPARESGGPLSTGEGLAYFVRDESDEERERRQKNNPNELLRDKDDKRLIILDEEFASGLSCTKREGNTLSMGIRCFWDSGEYAPLTKNNPISVRGAHINILTHITMQELSVCLGDVQAFNGFANRFLWICARRAKLVPLPTRMPEEELAPLQRELWKLIAHAQKCGSMHMTVRGLDLWKSVYEELSQEHLGIAGSIINRAEAQTIRLALTYALLDGKEHIDEPHLRAALSMWRYAQNSALYIFGDKASDPLEAKILSALAVRPLTTSELSAALSRNVPRDRLQPLLQQMESQRRITIVQQKNPKGRPSTIISLYEKKEENERNEFDELNEQKDVLL